MTDDSETVLIAINGTKPRPTYHLPSESDPREPRCGVARQREGAEWYPKARAAVEDHKTLCALCDPDQDQDFGKGSGCEYRELLLDLDPDEANIGGSA